MTDQEYIYKIAQGDNRAFTTLYNQYQSEFAGYIRKCYKGDSQIIFESYQEACVALYDNIRSGKLQVLNPGVKLKTYLFRIGYYKFIDLIRPRTKNIGICENIDYTKDYDSEYADDCSERFAIIRQAIDTMKEPCNTILSLYYWEDKSIKEIALLQGYANPDSAKSQKSKCMGKLKIYIKTLLNK